MKISKRAVRKHLLCAIMDQIMIFERNEPGMAKKTAAQKGYRKTNKKKPFLTKKEIIALIIIVVVVIGAFILIQNLPDGFIGEKEIQPGDVVAYASSDNKTRFLKVADANEIEGFTRVNSAEGVGAMPTYTYTPDDEESPISYITLSGSAVEASLLSDTTLNYFSGAGSASTATEKMSTTVQGHDAYVFAYSYSYFDETKAAEEAAEEVAEVAAEEAVEEAAEEVAEVAAEEAVEEAAEEAVEEAAEEAVEEAAEVPAENAPNTYMQNMTVYTDYDGEHTIALHLCITGDDDSVFIPDDQVLDYILPYTDAFTILTEEAK